MDGRKAAIIVGLYIAIPVAGSIVAFFMIFWDLFGPRGKDGKPLAPKSNLVTCLLIIGATALISVLLLKGCGL